MNLPDHPMEVEELTAYLSGTPSTESPKKTRGAKAQKTAEPAAVATLDSKERCYCSKCDDVTMHLVVQKDGVRDVAISCEKCGEKRLVDRQGLLSLKMVLVAK
jgi:RNase P subunit RPR2